MVKRLTVIFVVCLFGLSIFAGGAFAATAKKTTEGKWTRHISEDINIDGPGWELYRAPSKPISKYRITGAKDYPTCDDIEPAVGIIIQHDPIGYTWYEYQKNGSMGRMMSVTDDGYRHFSWMFTDGEYPAYPRYVDANCVDPTYTNWMGQTHADGCADSPVNAGYCNQTHEHDGVSVIIHHRTGPVPGYCWNCVITMDDILCGGYFGRHWDIPDAINGAPSKERGMWPKGEVCYDALVDTDYVHVVMTEGETAGGVPVLIAWERTHRIAGDAMLCEACLEGNRVAHTVPVNTDMGWSDLFPTMDPFDVSCSITPVVTVSPVSKKVAIVYMRPSCDGTCNYLSDIYYIESTNNGEDWLSDCANWPPTPHVVIEYGCELPNERGWSDLNATYDYNDELHIVWVTAGFRSATPGSYYPGEARLYHYSVEHGISTIHSAIWEETDAGAHNVNIAKPSISAKDPIYHPGGDSVYLFCIWSQFDTADNAANALTNSEIYGTASFNGGYTWGGVFNLTNTRTPECEPGDCVSEHWSSLAQNMYNGDLHIQYICDRDPGGATTPEGQWTDNPVYYLQLAEWPVGAECRTAYAIIDPAHWYQPFLKVTPGGSIDLEFEIENVGNASCSYNVSSEHPLIVVSQEGTLVPKEKEAVIVNVVGPSEDTFINGTVKLWTSEGEVPPGKTEYLRVQAVVAEDYYECPNDPETVDTLENDFLRLYVNANCQQGIHDIATFPDTHEVFFQGGTFIATHSEDYIDTLVGRYMGQNDQHAGAREKLYVEDRGDYWVLYTSNIFMHDLNPPAHDSTWYWFELIKEVVFFKPSASDTLQHCAIKYVTVERHDPPAWWPEQPPPRGYQDTYVGIAMDIDCPFDSAGEETGDENGCNYGRYDDVNHIAYQTGFGRDGEHGDAYNNYHVGIAMINGGGGPSGEEEAYKTHCIKNNQYLYPQSPWGWNDEELYELASDISGGRHQIDFGPPYPPDSIVDRTYVVTAQKIEAERDECDVKASFTMVEVVAPDGEVQMQAYVQAARAWVEATPLILCGDVNGDKVVDLGDIVFLINYVFKNTPEDPKPPPIPPINRGDVNSDCVIDLGDIVYLINYVFKNTPEDPKPDPDCPGVW